MNIKTAYIMGCAGKQLEHLESAGLPATFTVADIQKAIFQDPNIETILPAEDIEFALNFAVDCSFLEMEGDAVNGVVYKRYAPPVKKFESRSKQQHKQYRTFAH